ncbi:class I SAM-dependent methyltransferase [Planotetraspora mira]|nr:class I SAM-dependent methyltransferase [Planotetraspora mira]
MGLDDLMAGWRADLESWAIPDEILAKAPTNPWTHQVERFARRTGALLADPKGPTYERAREALPRGGSVLDVGAGTGAASLPLGPALLVAVDENAGMLAELGRQARGTAVQTVEGRWPDVADRTPVADVVVCAHVVFNVPDLAEFFVALDRHARRRVVLELPEIHPTSWLNPLWEHFHGLPRPATPTAADAVSIAEALGFDVAAERYPSPDTPFASAEEMAASACRRLCLDPGRASEVIKVATELGVWPAPRRTFVTMWWDRAADE